MNDLSELLKLRDFDAEEVAQLQHAYAFAKEVHKDHKRLSGEPYLVHSLETAKTLANLRMEAPTIAAGLLHDTLGEEDVTEESLTKQFGADIAELITQVAQLEKIRYTGTETNEKYVENLRKLFMVTGKDVRVLIIRLAHRLHNVQTLSFLPAEKRKRIALETIEIYAPIANRLGMRKLKGELEDAAFPHAYPEQYETVKNLLEKRREEIHVSLEKFSKLLQEKVNQENLSEVKTEFRTKQLYSLYKKLEELGMDISRVFDVAGLRVITKNVAECYQMLGIIHSIWTPVPGRLRDYIAAPKPSGYQSIHTVVFTGDGNMVEIQIRTDEMDREAEYGIASHLAYSETGKKKIGGILSKKMLWLKQLLEWQKSARESQEFLEDLKMDFFNDQVFTFTPKGDVIELPEGSSPIDFAYAIHSDVGDRAFGSKINGKFVSLDTKLQNGDIVEIQTRNNAKPSQKWLDAAKTSQARQHIRKALGEKKR